MNEKPHIHDLRVADINGWWRITYGDQDRWFEKLRVAWYVRLKPTEEEQLAALRNHIAGVIRDHDMASMAAGRRHAIIESVKPTLRKKDVWGSLQIK